MNASRSFVIMAGLTLFTIGTAGCNGALEPAGASNGSLNWPPAETPTSGANTLVVHVVEPDGSSAVPVPSATVTLESPALDAAWTTTSDADGKAIFPNLDFTKGGVTVTAHQSGHRIATLVGISSPWPARKSFIYPAADTAPLLVLERMPEGALSPTTTPTTTTTTTTTSKDYVTLSGAIKGKSAADTFVTISSIDGEIFHDQSSTFSVKVAKGQPIVLVGLECTTNSSGTSSGSSKLRWMRWEVPAITASDAATFDLDLAAASPLTPTRTSLTMSLPSGLQGASDATPFWTVRGVPQGRVGAGGSPSNVGFFLGSQDQVDAVQGSTASWSSTGQYVSMGNADHTPFWEASFPGQDGESTQVAIEGIPRLGSTIDFLPFAPSPRSTRLGNDIPLDKERIDPEKIDALEILIADKVGPDGSVVWVISTVPGQPLPTTMPIPQLQPHTRVLLPQHLVARMATTSNQTPSGHPERIKRIATGRVFRIER